VQGQAGGPTTQYEWKEALAEFSGHGEFSFQRRECGWHSEERREGSQSGVSMLSGQDILELA
jgi:hypothetical protein